MAEATHLLGLPSKHKKRDIIDEVESLVAWVKTNRWHYPFQTSSLKSTFYDLTAERLYAVPFVFPRKVKVTKLGISIVQDNLDLEDTHARLGLYDDNNVYPNDLIEQVEVVLYSGGRVCELTFSTAQDLRGFYWAVLNIEPYDYDILQALHLHYARGYQPLAGLTSVPTTTGGFVNTPVYYKNQTYGSLPSKFPAGATETYTPILAFVVYITELL